MVIPHQFLLAVRRFASPQRLADGLLLMALAAIAFLLGCYELADTDVWWHLRGGQWIIEHGRVPSADPFTFGSEDKIWVDIHWSYEVILALAYRAGGAAALVVLGAAFGGCAFLACACSRQREWPVCTVALCWMPALILFAFRLDPRPEIFSLCYLGCLLTVLWRLDARPALAWFLPLLQVLWVNAQGLFILGPILTLLYVGARCAPLIWHRNRANVPWDAIERRRWRHIGGATVCVIGACLVNPYFIDGARFPFDLFPKIASEQNAYKNYIDELMSPRTFVERARVGVAGRNWFFLSCYFLLLSLPASFLFPAVWRAWSTSNAGRVGANRKARQAPYVGPWLSGLTALVALLVWSTLTLSGKNAPLWIIFVGDNVPIVLVFAGAGAAVLVRKRSREAAGLALLGGASLAAWIIWLQAALLEGGRGVWSASTTDAVSAILLVLDGSMILWMLRWHADVFRILLAIAFAYLGLQAIQNWSRFALVAGTILAWNLGEWTSQLAVEWQPAQWRGVGGWCLRGVVGSALGLWIAALVADRFYVHTGEPRHFGFREQPLEFAHEAAIFAGQSGLPERALVYGLGQTGVYDFHNAPRCKAFMDGRLEMPDQSTFERYVRIENWLRANDPRWEMELAQMGNPLVLLEHINNHDAEAALLTRPKWRCIYYDALASIFVHQDQVGSESSFPAVDFARRHFRQPMSPSIPDVPGAAAREEKALFNLGSSLARSPDVAWRGRIPVLLNALDRGGRALEQDPQRPDVWIALGNSYWNLIPDLTAQPPTPADDWRLEESIYWAQATYCHRRALELKTDEAAAWQYLFVSYRARSMLDALVSAGDQWINLDPKVSSTQRDRFEELRTTVERTQPRESAPILSDVADRVYQLLRANRPEAAERMIRDAERLQPLKWKWEPADRAGGLYMHLGRPADARRIWEAADECPSVALRESRIGSTFWVERDFDAAIRHFRAARATDPQLGESAWALAMLYTQLGMAEPALEACREGLNAGLKDRQRRDLEALQRLLESAG
jgi:tetratricopeptide (TPR) repeat protein